MHKVNVCLLPSLLSTQDLDRRAVAVFDVLRATTTITAALAAGIEAVHLFGSPEQAASAALGHGGRRILAGERQCLPPAGFDRGNSPGEFTAADAGCVLFFATTNGTRALLAAAAAPMVAAAALVNASAVAALLAGTGRDILLLCAGTEGAASMEDVIGCGAVVEALVAMGAAEPETDLARMAQRLYLSARDDLATALQQGQGGRNVIRAGLQGDITFAARLDVLSVVGILKAQEMTIVRA